MTLNRRERQLFSYNHYSTYKLSIKKHELYSICNINTFLMEDPSMIFCEQMCSEQQQQLFPGGQMFPYNNYLLLTHIYTITIYLWWANTTEYISIELKNSPTAFNGLQQWAISDKFNCNDSFLDKMTPDSKSTFAVMLMFLSKKTNFSILNRP